jgi:hypothetical protein
MAKAKVATRKKGSKRRKASAKVERKSAARRAAAKKVKLEVRRAGGVARRSMTKRQRAPKVAATKVSRKPLNQVVEAPVEDTIIDVTEEPVPGVIDVTEDHTIATADSTPSAASGQDTCVRFLVAWPSPSEGTMPRRDPAPRRA